MAYENNYPVLVTTVDNKDYLHPSKNKDGVWVVSASTINMEPNKIVLYNPTTRIYTPVNPVTVSPDYYKQAKIYQDRLTTQTQGMARSNNPAEVNSFADVFMAGMSDYKPIVGAGRAVKKLFQGDFAGAAKTWWEASDVNMLIDKGKALWDLTEDFVVKPLISDDKLGTKAVKLLQNSLVNLSESLDFVTGANLVKGLIQEGLPSIPKGMGYADGGRVQYDWNIKTGGGNANDIFANTMLEIMSDPTNWVSFGTAAIMKSVGKRSISNLVSKSASDIGKPILKSQADEIAEAAARVYIYKDSTLTHAISRTNLGRYINDTLTPDEAGAFLNALKTNSETLKGARTMRTLKSLRNNMDAAQAATVKAVGYTSALGLGYHTVKGVVKYGGEAFSYMTHVLNKISKNINPAGMTLKNYPEFTRYAGLELNKLSDVVGYGKEYAVEAVKQMSHTFQEMQTQRMAIILSQKADPNKILKEFNDYAIKQGFADGKDLFLQLGNTAPDDLRKQLAELGNQYSVVYDKAVVDVVDKAYHALTKETIASLPADEVFELMQAVRNIMELGVTPTISAELFQRTTQHLSALHSLYASADLRAFVNSIDTAGYKTLRRKQIFKYGAVQSGQFVDMTEAQLKKMIKNKLPMNGVFATMDMTQAKIVLKELAQLEATLDVFPAVKPRLVPILDEIQTAVNTWTQTHLPIEQAMTVNASFAALKNQVQLLRDTLATQPEAVLKLTLADTEEAIDALSSELKTFLDDYRATFSKEEVANVYTDVILDSTARNTADSMFSSRVADIAHNNGVAKEDIEQMFTKLTNYNPDAVLSKNNKGVKDAYKTLVQLADLMKEMKIDSYFIDELGLYQIADDWKQNGFSIDLGNELLRALDDAITHTTRGTVLGVATSLQLFRDEVQALIDRLNETAQQRVQMTDELISSKLYAAQLSQVQAISWLLSTDTIQSAMTEIRQGVGLGQLLEALADTSLESPSSNAVELVQNLASSVLVANKLFELVKTSKLPDTWKNGVYDAYAGEIRKHVDEIFNAEYYASLILNTAKEFIDRGKDAHPAMLHDLVSSADPLRAVDELFWRLFEAKEYKPTTTRHTDATGKVWYTEDKHIHHIGEEMWDKVSDELAKDFKDTFNLVYSANTTAYQSGDIMEIAFKAPDGTRVKFVNKTARDIFKKTATEDAAMKVYGKRLAEVLADLAEREAVEGAETIVCKTPEDFAKALYEYFKNVKTVARQYGVAPRLVGFNNASDSLATDKLLARFMDYNKTNTHIVYNSVDYKSIMTIRSFDTAQWLRVKYNNAAVITDTLLKEMTEITRKVQVHLERANAHRVSQNKVHLMPDFDTTVTTALRELKASIDNVVDIWINEKPAVVSELDEVEKELLWDYLETAGDMDDVDVSRGSYRKIIAQRNKAKFSAVTKEQYAVIRHSFRLGDVLNFRDKINTILEDMGASLAAIRDSNTKLGQYLLIQKNVYKLLGERNVMNILHKYFAGSNGVSPYSYKKVYDPTIFNEWFDIKQLTEQANITDLTTYIKMNEIAERMNRQIGRITHIELIMDIPEYVVLDAITLLKEVFRHHRNYLNSEWAKEVLLLRTDKNHVNNFMIAKLLYDSIVKVSDNPTINEVYSMVRDSADLDSAFLMHYIAQPDETIFFKEALYTPGLPVFHSELITDSNQIMQLIKQLNAAKANLSKAETIYDALTLNDIIKEQTGMTLPSMQIKRTALQAYDRFNKAIQFKTDAVNKWYLKYGNHPKAEQRIYYRKLYTDRIKEIIAMVDTVATHYTLERMDFFVSLSAEDYAMTLYKYVQGVQMIDMASEAMRSHPTYAIQLMRMLKDAEQYGVEYVEDLDNHKIYVYLNKETAVLPEKFLPRISQEYIQSIMGRENYNLLFFKKAAETFELNAFIRNMTDSDNDLYAAIEPFMKTMNEQFEGTYSVSMMRMNDRDKFREFLKAVPEEIKDKIISEDYLIEHDMIGSVFMQNVLGDYTSGVGTVFSTHSSNLITNVAASFNAAFNKFQGRDLYISALYGNPENYLRNWVNSVHRVTPVTHVELIEALRDHAYVVAELTDDGVRQVDISTSKKYEAALQTNAVLIDYYTYTRSIEVINDNKIRSELYHKINRNYFGALKAGMLISPGFLARNIFDSSIKEWLRDGLNPAWFGRLIKNRRIMTEYQKAYYQVFTGTDGNMTPMHVKKYLDTNDIGMSRQLFEGLLTFYNSSSSVPTPIQMQLSSNLIHNLYLRVKGNPRIREADVEFAVGVFKETMHLDGAYKEAQHRISAKYRDATVVDTLMLLRKYVPEKELQKPWFNKVVEGIPTTNWIMNMNNDVETLMRTTAFLDEFYYKGGNVASGIQASDSSQFNRAQDSKGRKWLEFFLPFSAFQMDNLFFWTDTMRKSKNNVVAFTEDVVSGMYDDDDVDLNELANNMSLQYLYMSGNLILDEDTGLTLKLNGSLHNTLQYLINPIETVAGMLNVPMETLRTMLVAINADEEAYDKDSYNNPKPISRWTPNELTTELLQLIPLVGVMYQRTYSMMDKAFNVADTIPSVLMPSLFSISKLNSNIPVGYDWYDQTEEYKKTHRYVFGVSYVPAWMRNDPTTFVNTYQRLIDMGYPAIVASHMMQTGWYINKSTYELMHYNPRQPKQPYARKVYTRFKRTYPKKQYTRKQRKLVRFKINKPFTSNMDRVRTTRYGVRRVYRTRLYSDQYTRTGVPRETLIRWRGANRSSRQLLIDRRNARRSRTQRIIRQTGTRR